MIESEYNKQFTKNITIEKIRNTALNLGMFIPDKWINGQNMVDYLTKKRVLWINTIKGITILEENDYYDHLGYLEKWEVYNNFIEGDPPKPIPKPRFKPIPKPRNKTKSKTIKIIKTKNTL